jgi:hypothetical protein
MSTCRALLNEIGSWHADDWVAVKKMPVIAILPGARAIQQAENRAALGDCAAIELSTVPRKSPDRPPVWRRATSDKRITEMSIAQLGKLPFCH